MIRKSGYRFSEKIMLKLKDGALSFGAVNPQQPFLRTFATPALLCAFGLVAALAAVLQFSLRAYVPGSLDPGGFTLANFTDLLKPLYARVFLDTVWICF